MLGDKCTVLSFALCRLYTAEPAKKWIYSDLEGILCLIWDREE